MSETEGSKPMAHSASKLSKNASSFTQKTPEYKFLKKMLETGDIEPLNKPADVYYRHGSLKKYATDQFRSQFNKLKSATGLHTRARLYYVCKLLICVFLYNFTNHGKCT